MDYFGVDLVPRSPEWWGWKLSRAIHDRNRGSGYSVEQLDNPRGTRPALKLLDAWSRCEPPLPSTATKAWVDSWKTFLRSSRTNYAELVVSSVAERLVPMGWTTGVDSDGDGDAEATRIARQTHLMVRAGDAIEDMLTFGSGYLLVGKSGNDVTITRESPFTTYVAKSTATGKPLAGLRSVTDEWTGEAEHWLYLPGSVQVARKGPDGTWSFGEPAQIPDGRFPLVEFTNRHGVGEFERHLDVLTRINDTMFTRIVLTKLQAHRQHAIEKPAPKDGEEVEYEKVDPADFVAGPDAMWDLPPGTKVWESGVTDMGPVRMMVQDDVKALCAVTGTPLADMVPDAANQSAKGTEAVQEKFFNRVLDRQRRVDVNLAETLSLAFAAAGDPQRADASTIHTQWAPIQRYSLTEKAQAASQLKGIWPAERIALDVMQARPSELADINRARLAETMIYGTGQQAAANG